MAGIGVPARACSIGLGDDTSLRASWGRFVQGMSIEELPVSDGVTEFADAQRAEHWLLSFERRVSEAVDLRIEGYHKRYTDPQPRYENLLNRLVILPEVKPDRVRFDPVRARAVGLEASLRSVRSRPLFWWASYAWSRAEDELSDAVVRRSWDQEHALNFGLGWKGERWELSLAGLWRSGWPTTQVELVATEDGAVLAGANRQRAAPGNVYRHRCADRAQVPVRRRRLAHGLLRDQQRVESSQYLLYRV